MLWGNNVGNFIMLFYEMAKYLHTIRLSAASIITQLVCLLGEMTFRKALKCFKNCFMNSGKLLLIWSSVWKLNSTYLSSPYKSCCFYVNNDTMYKRSGSCLFISLIYVAWNIWRRLKNKIKKEESDPERTFDGGKSWADHSNQWEASLILSDLNSLVSIWMGDYQEVQGH